MSSSLMGSAIKALAANAPFHFGSVLRLALSSLAAERHRTSTLGSSNFHFGQQYTSDDCG